MLAIDRLRREAAQACKGRGHRMGRFAYERSGWKTRAYAECRNCGAGVTIDTRPMPNGIDIGGDAVAVDCRKAA